MSRPIQPSTTRQLAQFLALLDPRCGAEQHNEIAKDGICPSCHLDLGVYVAALPRDWPES